MNNNPIFKFAVREDLKNSNFNFLPTRAEPFATGYDVRSAKTLSLYKGDYFKIPLGFRAFPPEGWWFLLHPRSSTLIKKYMHGLVGIVDEHYENEVMFVGQYLPQNDSEIRIINFGDPIGQIIPVKRIDMVVEEISSEEFDLLCENRISFRNGGFGSTSK